MTLMLGADGYDLEVAKNEKALSWLQTIFDLS